MEGARRAQRYKREENMGPYRKSRMRRKNVVFALAVMVTWALGSQAGGVQEDDDKERAELAKALTGAKATLEEGLVVSQRIGTPISAEFEIEGGKLQLSVFTMKGEAFFEVTVDPKTGYIVESERITGREDLADAIARREAMVKARVLLHTVTERAVKANAGFRAVSVVPTLENGRPIAEVTLVKGEEFKTVLEELD